MLWNKADCWLHAFGYNSKDVILIQTSVFSLQMLRLCGMLNQKQIHSFFFLNNHLVKKNKQKKAEMQTQTHNCESRFSV